MLNNIEIQYFKGESSTLLNSKIYFSHLTIFKNHYHLLTKGVVKQLHGSFMVVAWLMAASVGVFLPRYMKKTWVGKKIMKKDRWFMVTTHYYANVLI